MKRVLVGLCGALAVPLGLAAATLFGVVLMKLAGAALGLVIDSHPDEQVPLGWAGVTALCLLVILATFMMAAARATIAWYERRRT